MPSSQSRGGICKLEGDLPIGKRIIHDQEFELLTNDVSYLTHTIHKYPSKFIPQIPRWAIRKYLGKSSNGYIYDPMCGSGTTLLEALLHGHNSVGVDIDPLACLISKVKVTLINPKILDKIFFDIKNKIARRKKGKFLPKIENLDHWFTDETKKKLSIIRDIIDEYKDERNVYDFLIIVFSSIIRKASNADNQSQKTYVSHNVIKNLPDPNLLFLHRLKKYSNEIKKLSESYTKTRHFVFNTDTRKIQSEIKKIRKDSFDLAITSPPYIKAIDYIYTNMAEYFWIGDIFGMYTKAQQNEHKRNYIGTKQVYSNEYNSNLKPGINEVDVVIQKIKKKNVKFGYITSKFFEDIQTNLKSTFEILKPNSHYIMVVGNCSVAGIDVPVDKLVSQLAKVEGFTLKNNFSYVIRNRYMRFPRQGRGGLITHDIVLDFSKT